MKKIGLIMGTSWESSKEYYAIINKLVNKKLGGQNCAEMIMVNINFEEVNINLKNNDWKSMTLLIENAAHVLEKAGADFYLICTNTLHNCVDNYSKEIQIPLLHIADATARAIQKDKVKKVLLLGTKATMSLDFYKKKLSDFGIEVIVPNNEDMNYIDSVIFNEMCKGKFLEESKKGFLNIIEKSKKDGAQGVVLACTEIPMLIEQKDSNIPLYDTMTLHAVEAVEYALK
ncbi:MAG: aspartate/glutamate racemase family protein [Candidatus Aenigmarchaeota archaeon]|nr:aspartate/glutamate racemase family protein [Candidatus Aenigmarchaeota archaeon]